MNKKYHKIRLKNTFKKKNPKFSQKYLFIPLIGIIIVLLIIIFKISIIRNLDEKERIVDFGLINLDKFETNIFDRIKEKLDKSKCSLMWKNHKEFLNGVIRKFKPNKILEVGVRFGGSSIIILNAIQDIPNSHLYSVDISNSNEVGRCLDSPFSELKNKWTLFKGNIVANFIENIGKEIDLVLFDTTHFEPGEILDFLMVLPFLKEEAIVMFHDIGNQINMAGVKDSRHEWAPYIIFNLVKGKKFYPSGDNILLQDIGAIMLDKNQNKYIYDYFRALGGQWEYFLSEIHINILRNFFKKYYDEICLSIFEEAIKFNRYFVQNNQIIGFYNSKVWINYYKYKIKYN